jgi:acyl transferase domain-containing protein
LVADRQQALRDILQSELSVSVTHNYFAIHRNIEALAQDFALKIANTRQVLTPDLCSTSAIDLSSLAHTLQVGRSALGQRLAFVAVDIQAVRVGLSSFIAGNVPVLEGPQNLRECAELFLSGRNIAWSEMRTLPYPLRLGSLPTYPFEHKRYWVDAWLDSSPQDIQTTHAVNPLVMTPQRDDMQALRKVWNIDGSEPALGQLMQASSISVLAGVNADHLALGLSDSVLPCFTDWNDGVVTCLRRERRTRFGFVCANVDPGSAGVG